MNELPLIETWDQLASVVPPFVVRCGAAALCGAMIGLERELKRKPAGFRTNILICVGAATLHVGRAPARARGRRTGRSGTHRRAGGHRRRLPRRRLDLFSRVAPSPG